MEVWRSQDEELVGRVQCDKDVLREGRFRLHVSRLRTEDLGLYLCEVKTRYGLGVDGCHLDVTGGKSIRYNLNFCRNVVLFVSEMFVLNMKERFVFVPSQQ